MKARIFSQRGVARLCRSARRVDHATATREFTAVLLRRVPLGAPPDCRTLAPEKAGRASMQDARPFAKALAYTSAFFTSTALHAIRRGELP